MSNFKIGDTVICINDSLTVFLVKGEEYVVDGFSCCSGCGNALIYLREIYVPSRQKCLLCNSAPLSKIRPAYATYRFEKPIQYRSAIYSLISKEIVEEKQDIIPIKEKEEVK